MTELRADAAHITTYLERRTDVLLSVGDPRPIHRELELHWLSIGLEQDAFARQLVKDGLAALAFYMVSRPRVDTFGWTISLQRPLLNLFFTGSADDATVVGRAFLDNIQPAPRSLFIVQTVRPRHEPQRSSVEVDGVDIFAMVEHYSEKSDQQPVRYFHGTDERLLQVASLPEVNRDWLGALQGAEAFALLEAGDLKFISRHAVRFHCGCDRQRILDVVRKVYANDPEDLFRDDPSVEAECPRCGTKHVIRREDFHAGGV